jgi:DNA helicase-2/ATP-dependent DNA helicase PcrA
MNPYASKGYGQGGYGGATNNVAKNGYSAWTSGGFSGKSMVESLPPQAKAPAHGIRAGMQVFHNKFGEGAVISVEGIGDDARAQVKFGRHGIKWLALSVAKLTPV